MDLPSEKDKKKLADNLDGLHQRRLFDSIFTISYSIFTTSCGNLLIKNLESTVDSPLQRQEWTRTLEHDASAE